MGKTYRKQADWKQRQFKKRKAKQQNKDCRMEHVKRNDKREQ